MNTQSRLIETAVLGAAIVTFGLAAGGKAKTGRVQGQEAEETSWP